ncbi:leukotriene B4 receptor 2a [Oryzias melastigma]|uniref:Leukotriene B4 receptor 2a n=1 Tax=Oryzias melastigma TaxID=30732 RepID=A0A3B3CGG9_ORYME|nr:leukotriene B4 receptor 2a [Oryzias melastigma]
MNLGNHSHSTHNESIVDSTAGTNMGALILSLVFIVGFPGNIFVIWSILARARKQSITTLLILNLACADGSLMALTPFFIVYLIMKNWVIGDLMCKILFYLCLLNMYASIYLIMLMSVYRLVSVIWPQRVSKITGKRTIRRVLAVTWVLVMVASIPALVFRQVRCKKGTNIFVCDSFHDEDNHVVLQYMMEIVLGFLIPYGVILVSYICILRRIRQTKFRRRVRSEKLILAIVLTFCLFWLPYHVVNVLKVAWALCKDETMKTKLDMIGQRSRAVTSSIAFISSSINPILYFFAGKSYIRREGLAFMARLFEGTGFDSTRKSRQNSQNSRDKDKDADVRLKDKDLDSVSNSVSNAVTNSVCYVSPEKLMK